MTVPPRLLWIGLKKSITYAHVSLFPPNVKKLPYMTLLSAFSGPHLKSTVEYAMCCFSLRNARMSRLMTVASAFSGSFQNHFPQCLCAASFSRTREDYVYGCLCLRLLWTDSKPQSRTTCAASSSQKRNSKYRSWLSPPPSPSKSKNTSREMT